MVEKGLAGSSNSVGQDTTFVNDNYSSILKNLDEIKNDRFNGDDVAKSFGIKKVMLNLEFRMARLWAKKCYPCFSLQTQLYRPEVQDRKKP